MKTPTTIFQFAALFLFAMCSRVTEKFSFQPNYPQPGEEITITYNPAGTSLENASEISLLAYCYPEGMPIVKEVVMKESADVWEGTFKTADTTLVVYIIFRSGDQQDDNNKNGYLISQFTSQKKPVKGGMARQAEVAFSGGTYPFRLERDWEKALEYYEKEFKLYPEQSQNWNMVNSYWYPLHNLNKDSATRIIKTRLEKLEPKENKTITELHVLINWYEELKEIELADKYEKELIEREPYGSHEEFKRFMECAKEDSLDKKQKLTLSFINDFPKSEYIDQLNRSMISALARKNLFNEAENYVNSYVNDPGSKYYDKIAWSMIKKEIRMERAVELAALAVKKARLELQSEEKPGHYTQKEWQERQNSMLGDVLDTYGLGLYKIGKIEKSVDIYKEAVELNLRKSRGIRERYCRSLYDAGQIDKTYTELESIIKEDPFKQNLYAFFKEVYIKYKGSEEGYESLVSEAKKEHRIKMQNEIKDQIIEIPAPGFDLKDLNGNRIRLTDYNGKIIVLDFWATWCGPCIGSFPAMQKLVDKNKENDQIKFLFIDTWEEGDDIDKKVQDFITEKKYTFHVLRDAEDSVVNAYKVLGIPTKFVIDPNGNIRFRIKGSKSNEIELIEELEIMIALLN